MADITPKQARFVEEYLVDMNATQAAIRAGYSAKNAHKIASELLGKTGVGAAVRKAQTERSERTAIDADWVLNRLAVEAQADVADLMDENGHIRPVCEWPMIWRQGLVSGMDVSVEWEKVDGEKKAAATVTKLRLSDRIRRLELIGKHVDVGAFSEKHEHSGKLEVVPVLNVTVSGD